MIKRISIRELKARLGAFLKDVQRGDVILVTDRGQGVAEIKSPPVGVGGEAVETRVRRLVEEGTLKLGLRNTPDAYRRAGISLPNAVVDSALSWARGEWSP